MGDKGETAKKQQSQQVSSSSPKDPLEESTETTTRHQQQPQVPVVVTGPPFISAPLYIPIGATSSPFEQQFESAVNPKRPRYNAQWKLLPSPSSQQQKQTKITESSPSPTTNPLAQQPHSSTAQASSSDTASSPSDSPIPSHSAASGHQETVSKQGEKVHQQIRKGKYVSPVWKPNEMLWLARAWRVQYQGGSEGKSPDTASGTEFTIQSSRGKTRAEKDKEVAEYLQRHGVNRDSKTAGTKWDNMLGEFRKVYEWERGGEREQLGKSYFRLSPYERKMHRLPASFDEEVFEELAHFMGPRVRTPQSRGTPNVGSGDDNRNPFSSAVRALPPPPPFREDDHSLSARAKQLVMSTSGGETYFHGGLRGSLLGFETSMDVATGVSSSSKELKRIGKVRMTWEESVSLWGEEGDHHRGRVRLQGSSFLNADELAFFDDSVVACTMEAFEDGPLKGFSVDKFVSGQQVKVFGRRKSSSISATSASGFNERVQLPLTETSIRSAPPWEYQDPSEFYVGCLRMPPTNLPSLFELSWYIQEPPTADLRFPIRRDVYRDLPPGKEQFFTTSTDLIDCRGITYDILSSILRPNPSISAATASSRDSYIGLWDDCINRIVAKFCSVEMILVRKPCSSSNEAMQDQWPNVTGFVRNFCLWRGEETDQIREGQKDPSSTIIEKLLWTYLDLPYILGYYAVGYKVTFCAITRAQDRLVRTDIHSLDLSSPSQRLKALVSCYRLAGLLPLLADRCVNNFNSIGVHNKQLGFSDFERIDLGHGNVMDLTPNTVTRFFSNKRKWAAVKEIYDNLDDRIPHAEFLFRSLEKELALVFKPRGIKSKPNNCEQLVEALKYVTKALVALHDLSFMHRDLSWNKVLRRSDRENEWFVCGFDEAVGAPQIYPCGIIGNAEERERHAPEMVRGLHGVKVDVWGIGYLMKTSGLSPNMLPKMLKELQHRCLDNNPEQRPTAADCYHHLLQIQSSLQSSSSGVHY